MVRPRYRLPGDLRPASLSERQFFYASEMEYAAASQWMSRPAGRRVYALILGRHSGIYPRQFRHLKNVPLIVDDVEDAADLKPYLLRYRPEGVYYDRNVYAPAEEGSVSRVDYPNAWKGPSFRGQELAFDLDPENLDCPVHGDIVAKMERHQGLSFCDWEYVEIRRQAALLFDELSLRWKRLRLVFSGRGFHIHVFDEAGFRLSRNDRSAIAKSVARRYPIDEWVTSGEMRLIRLPYSLHGMVSRIVVPVPRAKLERFLYDDPRTVPRW
ncbi:MAG TPA: DNA primase [Thermoplasmata archaeon]|nr:DNA primase [Thermoplasmata archaeon]